MSFAFPFRKRDLVKFWALVFLGLFVLQLPAVVGAVTENARELFQQATAWTVIVTFAVASTLSRIGGALFKAIAGRPFIQAASPGLTGVGRLSRFASRFFRISGETYEGGLLAECLEELFEELVLDTGLPTLLQRLGDKYNNQELYYWGHKMEDISPSLFVGLNIEINGGKVRVGKRWVLGAFSDIRRMRKWQDAFDINQKVITDVDVAVKLGGTPTFEGGLLIGTKGEALLGVRGTRTFMAAQVGLQALMFLCYSAPGLYDLMDDTMSR